MSITRISEHRQRRAAARAYHPAVTPIFGPRDAIDTAQAFAAELDNAERGVSVDPHPERTDPYTGRHRAVTVPKGGSKSRLFTPGRFRKARLYDGLAVALLLALCAALGVVLFASTAKADDGYDPVAYAYASHYAAAVCTTLDDYPSVPGLLGIMQSIEEDGLTAHQAGEAAGIAVFEVCPRHAPIVEAFINRYSKRSVA